MDAEAKRPWWRRKRWLAAAVLLLVASYPLSLGPVMYATGQGWVGGGPIEAVYAPLMHVVNEAHRAGESAELVVEFASADGKPVLVRSRSEVAWWATAASAVADGYWAACVWCGEEGMGHASRADG